MPIFGSKRNGTGFLTVVFAVATIILHLSPHVLHNQFHQLIDQQNGERRNGVSRTENPTISNERGADCSQLSDMAIYIILAT